MAVNLTAPTQVIARVGGVCAVAATDLDFGTLTASAVSGVSQTDATGTVSITCTNAISFSVVVSEGMYSPGISQRRMQAASGVYMSYNIYTTAARNTIYPSSGVPSLITSDGNPLTVIAYGRIPAQTLTGIGSFTDVVTWSVTY
jgi:spore coat protein U-like protein